MANRDSACCLLLVGLALGLSWSTAAAQSPAASTEAADDESRLEQLITHLVLKNVPHDYEQAESWGKTKRVPDALKLRRDGWRVETYRTWREVNHGTWDKLQVHLADPAHGLRSRLGHIRPGDPGRTAFALDFQLPLAITARRAEWLLGVQMYSISVEATATIDLHLDCDLAVHTERGSFPPVLRLEPRVQGAKLGLSEFQIQRVSKLGGEFAQQATRLAHDPVAAKLAEYEPRLVEKCNAAIARHQDELRLTWDRAAQARWEQRRQAAETVTR